MGEHRSPIGGEGFSMDTGKFDATVLHAFLIGKVSLTRDFEGCAQIEHDFEQVEFLLRAVVELVLTGKKQ